MKLLLYSGGGAKVNQETDEELLRLLEKRRPSVAFIPSSFDDGEFYFEEFIEHYETLGFDDFTMFPIDLPFTLYQARRILSKDLVYLSGGNTFYFLKHLKRSGFAHLLQEYVQQGTGVLAGQSAGSIVMTPNIRMASLPDFDRDENLVGLSNWKAFGLVDFEFFPHFCNTRRYIHELNLASLKNIHPIMAAADGAGISVHGAKMSIIGDVWGFFRGKKFKFS